MRHGDDGLGRGDAARRPPMNGGPGSMTTDTPVGRGDGGPGRGGSALQHSSLERRMVVQR
jgi:hypothetical protein